MHWNIGEFLAVCATPLLNASDTAVAARVRLPLKLIVIQKKVYGDTVRDHYDGLWLSSLTAVRNLDTARIHVPLAIRKGLGKPSYLLAAVLFVDDLGGLQGATLYDHIYLAFVEADFEGTVARVVTE